jgi:RimJ/RimL family protein N-acetyltransferase
MANKVIDLRPLEQSDLQAFIDLQRVALEHAPELFGSDYDWVQSLSVLNFEQRFARYQSYPTNFILGAFDESSVLVGMVGFSCDHHSSKLRHKAKVWSMFVAPQHRGRGIATKLMESIIDTAHTVLDCEQIQLSVSTENTASYSLYLRLGFTVYGTEVHALKVGPEYVDEYLMVKFLRQ